MSKAVGEEIRRRRLAKGWGQTKLAAEAGMAVSGISQLENGKHNPTSATLEKVARALGVEVRELFPLGQAPLPEFSGERRFSLVQSMSPKLREEIRRVAALKGESSFSARTLGFGGRRSRSAEERERINGPMREFVNRRADYWENAANMGGLSLDSAMEFYAEVEDLAPTLAEMEQWDIAETPPEERKTEHALTLTPAIGRLLAAFESIDRALDETLTGTQRDQVRARKEEAAAKLEKTDA